MIIELQKISEKAVVPKQATEFAGGWDVVATEIIQESNDFVICKLGWAMQPPIGYKITIVPRSSLTKTHWIIQNSPCLGDADFTGEYQIRFRCLPDETVLQSVKTKLLQFANFNLRYYDFPYKVGDRIAQMYLEAVVPIEFREVSMLEKYERNPEGFGTTGN